MSAKKNMPPPPPADVPSPGTEGASGAGAGGFPVEPTADPLLNMVTAASESLLRGPNRPMLPRLETANGG